MRSGKDDAQQVHAANGDERVNRSVMHQPEVAMTRASSAPEDGVVLVVAAVSPW